MRAEIERLTNQAVKEALDKHMLNLEGDRSTAAAPREGPQHEEMAETGEGRPVPIGDKELSHEQRGACARGCNTRACGTGDCSVQ